MGFITSSKNNSDSNWGMGFFLVLFPDDQINNKKSTTGKPIIATTFNTLLRRTNSGGHLFSKAKSTISICALLVFFSLLIFTLSTFEPTTNHRRQINLIKLPRIRDKSYTNVHALQGMGTLYKRGTKGMNNLVICHVTDSVTVNDVELFLRLFHRSSLNSKSDLLFIFNSNSSKSFGTVIRLENDSFLKLVTRFKKLNGTASQVSSFDVTRFLKLSKKEKVSSETIWGKKIRSNNNSGENTTEFTRTSYGSVVSFEVDELDPENSLSGFLDHVPMSFRRWACYTMLLGRIRRNFKHVMLVDVKNVLLLGDPLGRVIKTPESVYLSTVPTEAKHGRKNSDKTESTHLSPSVIFGGARGIRRLSNAMLVEIVRVAMQHKRKNSVSESEILNKLVKNEFLLKNVKLIVSNESIPEASSLNSAELVSLSNHTVVRRGNSNIDLRDIFRKHICSFPLDSSVYSDC